jgi:hypothetical protein
MSSLSPLARKPLAQTRIFVLAFSFAQLLNGLMSLHLLPYLRVSYYPVEM